MLVFYNWINTDIDDFCLPSSPPPLKGSRLGTFPLHKKHVDDEFTSTPVAPTIGVEVKVSYFPGSATGLCLTRWATIPYTSPCFRIDGTNQLQASDPPWRGPERRTTDGLHPPPQAWASCHTGDAGCGMRTVTCMETDRLFIEGL